RDRLFAARRHGDRRRRLTRSGREIAAGPDLRSRQRRGAPRRCRLPRGDGHGPRTRNRHAHAGKTSMMIPERPTLERRVLAALDGSAGGSPRIPVLLGGCGSGRTSLLLRLRDLIGRTQAQYVDVERIATTPERFLRSLGEATPFPALPHARSAEPGAREAFDAALAFFDTARAPGGMPATFLLDEFLELRTFESFPGLRTVLRDLITPLAASGN